MRFLSEAWMYARFLRGLPRFLHDTITPEHARNALRRRLADREATLVHVAERGFFGAPRSPYRELFRLAGCGFSDFRRSVKDHGVEATLRALRGAGVYFSFEEFKGRTPVVRDGRELSVTPSDFDNPWLSHYYRAISSGTTGLGTRVSTDLDRLAIEAEHRVLLFDAHGVLDAPFAIWRPPLPSGSGINTVLRGARAAHPPEKWFTPLVPGGFGPPLKHRLATQAIVGLGRAMGARLPWPEPVPLDEAVRIARWMAEARDVHGTALLNTTVSSGLRVGLAARDAGLDLTGTVLMVAGEPVSPAKVHGIRASGAALMTDYGAAEAGRFAVACAKARDETDVHLLVDAYAFITWPRQVSDAGPTVDSFHVTHLHPSASKLLLNVELDDYGLLEERSCGCPLDTHGLRVHLRQIRSFAKLTGEGVTLVGCEMVHILEDVLPARFGGSSLDYQLVEEEDEAGLTRLTLLVSPSVPIADEREVIEAIHAALARESLAADMARAFWAQAGTLRVRREAPRVGSGGKQMPLRFMQHHRGADTK